MRRKTKPLWIGRVKIGGRAPISIQSMTKTFTAEVKATLRQIRQLDKAGCEIIRLAVRDEEDARALKELVACSPRPLIADIHFNPRLALLSLEAGVAGLRLNPGNIRNQERIAEIAREAKACKVPIRIGVNSGSLPPRMVKQMEQGKLTVPQAIVEAASQQIKVLEEQDFELIKISLKSPDVLTTVQAYQLMAQRCDYPFHCGITEAGPLRQGLMKSALGLGILIHHGLADTIRVSLTAPPVEEVRAARQLLEFMGEREPTTHQLISCPMCGRGELDVPKIVAKLEKELQRIPGAFTIAVMGCAVNGPGEARQADIGIAGGRGTCVLFRRGKPLRTLSDDGQILSTLLSEIKKLH